MYNVTHEPTSLRVNWTQALEPDNSSCPITNNKITWTVDGNDTSLNETEITASTTYIIMGLDGCTNYEVCVEAATVLGNYSDKQGCDTGFTGVIGKWLFLLWLLLLFQVL